MFTAQWVLVSRKFGYEMEYLAGFDGEAGTEFRAGADALDVNMVQIETRVALSSFHVTCRF